MAIWKKRGSCQDIAELVMSCSGMSMEELTNPQKVPASEIENIPEAAALLSQCLGAGMPIVIVGDYDVDGITATAILVNLLRWYGCEPKTIIPRRFTDGYGIAEHMLDGIRNSLVITVDNGISAAEALEAAKKEGNRVLVLDHHLSNTVPRVDVVVDPHVTGGTSGYQDYCGAGLALKLAEQLLPYPGEYPDLFYNLTVLACLGTIADVMPLTGDNRRIVREGLMILRSSKGFSMLGPGLREILKLGGTPLDEESIKFTIAPVLNAAGRMYDAGSTSALKAILCRDADQAAAYAGKMKQINEERKSAVSHWLDRYLEEVQPEKPVQILYLPGAPEGILGIIAGKLTEIFRMPAFVLSDSREPGIIKGSGRSYGDFDLFSVIEEVRDLTVAAGGHAGAAGISLRLEQLEALRVAIETAVLSRDFSPGEDILYYDLELRPSELPGVYDTQKQLGPFGEGCPQPVYLLRNFQPVARYGEVYKFMGSNRQHVKLYGPDFELTAFNSADEFRAMGLPASLDIVGTLGVNIWNGRTTVQFKPIAFMKTEE